MINQSLSYSLKSKIHTAIENKIRGQKFDRLKRKEEILAEVIYNAVVPEQQQIIMGSLPENHYKMTDHILVDNYAAFNAGYFQANRLSFKEGITKKCPEFMKNKIKDSDFPALRPLMYQLEDLGNSWKELRDTLQKARFETQKIMSRVRTVKRLLEEWPECREFIPTDDTQFGRGNVRRGQTPPDAISSDAVNEALRNAGINL